MGLPRKWVGLSLLSSAVGRSQGWDGKKMDSLADCRVSEAGQRRHRTVQTPSGRNLLLPLSFSDGSELKGR